MRKSKIHMLYILCVALTVNFEDKQERIQDNCLEFGTVLNFSGLLVTLGEDVVTRGSFRLVMG